MNKKTILLVEDDHGQMLGYQRMLKKLGHFVYSAVTKSQALESLKDKAIDILITDIHLTNSAERDSYEGYDILSFAKTNNPECLLIAMSNDPKAATYHQAKNLGAMNFLKKPICSEDEFEVGIITARENKEASRFKNNLDNYCLPNELLAKCKDGLLLSDLIREQIEMLAQSPEIAGVITGETGTGKEEVAKLVHKKRVGNEGPIPFVAVNCANLDANTAASQLFGHKKGSFTGADATTIGYVGEADGGILFLDEIHTLSLDSQRRLLRVLNDGSYQRLGDTKTLYSRFQVIVATGKDLDKLVNQGIFLADLRSRITGFFIELLPLRERLDDLDILVPLIFAKMGAKIETSEVENLVLRCKDFYWQDNIRQLYNVLKTTMAICQCRHKLITAADLQVYPSMLQPTDSDAPSMFPKHSQQGVPSHVIDKILYPLGTNCSFDESLSFYEKVIMEGAISRTDNFQQAAAVLSMPRSTFDNKRKKYGL